MTVSIMQELIGLLRDLKSSDYTLQLPVLSNATIGQHVRHSIEMYQCLLSGYHFGEVEYEKRKRDLVIEESCEYAIDCLQTILDQHQHADKTMQLLCEGETYHSSFNRELLYCNEHAIHHMALLKVGLKEFGDYVVNENFGVAPSTIKNRQQCAQ